MTVPWPTNVHLAIVFRMRSLLSLSFLLTILDTYVNGLIFPFDVRFGSESASSLNRRDSTPIGNIQNAQYVGNVSVAGVNMPVLLDTGSSDLWVNFPATPPTSSMNDTGMFISLSYAVGKAAGDVQTAAVSLGNLSIPNQAFLWVNDTSSFSTNIHSQGYDGLLGLGPNQSSVIRKKAKNGWADTFLQRIFSMDTSTQNYITLLLNRKNDPGQNITGQLTISEIVPGLENITSMPKLDVETVNRLLKSDQHWQALTDKNVGIIGPDGNPINIKSIVPAAPKGQLVAVVDSGYTFSQVPRDVSDAIYGRVQGAVYDTTNQYWLVPCGQYLNISFNLGGQNYPIHPLDTVDDNFAITDGSGKRVCIGAFQPITSAFSLLGHYDMILGMSFLRNAYMLLDFGDWIGETSDQEHPYIQLSSIVNSQNAQNDFVNVRLNGVNTISSSQWALLPASEMQHSPVSAEEKKKKYQEMILSRWPYIFVGCLLFVLIVVGVIVWKCCCRRKGKNASKAETEAALHGVAGGKRKGGFMSRFGRKRESYHALQTPAHSTADLITPTYPSQPRHSSGSQRPPPSPHASGHQSGHFNQNYDLNASTSSLHSYHDQTQYPSYSPQQQYQQYSPHQQHPSYAPAADNRGYQA